MSWRKVTLWTLANPRSLFGSSNDYLTYTLLSHPGIHMLDESCDGIETGGAVKMSADTIDTYL